MYEKLLKLLNNSYSPYSKFRVSAIVVMKDGTEFSGVNVENASYGASICAERSAIVSAISAGYKKDDFESYGIEYRKTIVCKKCHEEVDANAEVCPNCGHYVNKNNRRYVPISEKKAWSIKVFLGIICIIIFLVILATK